MLTTPQFLPARLAAVRNRIAAAARAAGRNPDDITLIGVTKTQSAQVVGAAIEAGLEDIGENYLQEALPKLDVLQASRDRSVWHYIGHLQSNKSRPVAEQFDWVHTVDRLHLAERLSSQRAFHGPALNICLQVKLGDEATKSGVLPGDLPALAQAVSQLPRLRLRGLMCIPPESETAEAQRGYFAAVRQLKDSLTAAGLQLDTLSMGMSADLEAAIMEGATHVRVGTAIFGERTTA
jgi:pyridoxal phosphate enzyme (YggS family)